jgi:MA3 domain
VKILDLTDQDLVNLRRTLYLTIMSSVSFEECAHKITKLKIPDGYELELCNMLGEWVSYIFSVSALCLFQCLSVCLSVCLSCVCFFVLLYL